MSTLPAFLLFTLVGSGKVELRFAPAEGSQVQRTITIDQSSAAKGVEPLATHQLLRTLDQYRRVGNGRALLLQRRFEQIEWSAGGDPDVYTSPFEGLSVVYTWVPEEAAYGKYYDAREWSEAALRDLAEDLDLRALLPTAAVETGEAWSVPVAQLRDVLAPLGDIDLRDGVPPKKGNLAEFFGGESKGECKLKLVSAGEPPSHPLATIELTLKLENKVKSSKAATWSFEGHGTLVWDLLAQRAASFALQGDQVLRFDGQRPALAGTLAYVWRIEDPASPPKK